MLHSNISPWVSVAALAICASFIGGCAGAAAPPSDRPSSTTSSTSTTTPSPSEQPEGTAASPEAVRVPAAVNDTIAYRPSIDSGQFSTAIDNPYFPLRAGTSMTYEGGAERIVVSVIAATRVVMGVETVVVRDRAYEDGRLIEDTEDWFAQDAAGNVWYFGEDTAECKDGAVISRHGAWEAGVDDAQPGIVMLADPRVGDHYRQEFFAGVAEDQARILRLDESVDGPIGAFEDVIVTEDFTPLEPDLLEHKLYAAGVGVVEERTISGGTGVLRLVERDPTGAVGTATTPFDPCRE